MIRSDNCILLKLTEKMQIAMSKTRKKKLSVSSIIFWTVNIVRISVAFNHDKPKFNEIILGERSDKTQLPPPITIAERKFN